MPSGEHARVPAETRIAACADYLLGVRMEDITALHHVTHVSLVRWISKTGHFKLRHHERKKSRARLGNPAHLSGGT